MLNLNINGMIHSLDIDPETPLLWVLCDHVALIGTKLFSELTVKAGRVEQSNFHDYLTLRIDQMPEVEMHILPSAEPPAGVDEPATPVIAPAVANAVYAATDQRLRCLPLRLA